MHATYTNNECAVISDVCEKQNLELQNSETWQSGDFEFPMVAKNSKLLKLEMIRNSGVLDERYKYW